MTAASKINTAVMKHLALSVLLCLFAIAAQAQIGYQVTLLNTATGEPRANETVNVTVEITNSENAVVCTETKSATTNDFGILSVAVGTADTFSKADWTKLPFFISATVDGVMIGKSQLLSVPVAEYAKYTGQLSHEFLNGKSLRPIGGPSAYRISFSKDYCTRSWGDDDPDRGKYFIIGNIIIRPYVNTIYNDDGSVENEHRYEVIYYADGRFFTEEYEWK